MRFAPLKIDRFLVAIAIVIGIAYAFPFGAEGESGKNLDLISTFGIALIFFFYGLKLSIQQLRTGLKNWKLHLLVQASTFLIFPLLVLPFRGYIPSPAGGEIWIAFLFLAALPSTVSSSVVMVSMAKGNLPAAIFNASISGLIGIVLTPLWLGLFLDFSSSSIPLGDIYIRLLMEILIPVILGISLQRFWGNYALRYSRHLTRFDKSIILIIIYKSFAESFLQKLFEHVDWLSLVYVTLGVVLLFYCMYFITGYLASILKFNREDRITAQYCGTKKSLVHGTVFSKVLFPAGSAGGMLLLPLMLFHAFQLLIISVLAQRAGRAVHEE